MKKDVERKKKFQKQAQNLGFLPNLCFFDAIEEKENWHLWCLLSHREIIKIAKDNKYKNILIFEDDAEVISENITYLWPSIEELRSIKWDIFYLGSSLVWEDLPLLEKNDRLYRLYGGRSTHAIAYNMSSFEYLLQITDNSDKFIKKYKAIDTYLSLFAQEKMKSFIPLKPIFKQKNGFSNIEKKLMSLDIPILLNFEKLTKRHFLKNKTIKFIRKIFVQIWQITNERVNMFFISYWIYNKISKKSIGKYFFKYISF